MKWRGGTLVQLLHPAYNMYGVPRGAFLAEPVLPIPNPIVNPRCQAYLDKTSVQLVYYAQKRDWAVIGGVVVGLTIAFVNLGY